jgi:hypothetical protein
MAFLGCSKGQEWEGKQNVLSPMKVSIVLSKPKVIQQLNPPRDGETLPTGAQ